MLPSPQAAASGAFGCLFVFVWGGRFGVLCVSVTDSMCVFLCKLLVSLCVHLGVFVESGRSVKSVIFGGREAWKSVTFGSREKCSILTSVSRD